MAETVHAALLRLGHVSILSDDLRIPNRRHIVFGSNTLSWWDLEVPDDAILYNLEQIVPGSKWAQDELLALFRRHTVWDYSRYNVAALAAAGVRNVQHVPIGSVPELERIPAAPVQDIDVLFVGEPNDRRRAPIERLREAGVNARAVSNVYGASRDALYARAKIVLNIHYDLRVFEIVRVSYLLANGIFVVSEDCVNDDETTEFSDAVVFTGYDRIVETCLRYLADPTARAVRGAAGREIMRRRPAARYLHDAVLGLRAAPDGPRLDRAVDPAEAPRLSRG
ncbi:glycosyltransferase [Nocardia sp. NEAU-G5]|uniref:Glycosyltransferase n=1 Tax=Nocardia albiluteola TaxID=2842303 RepID=A0ABS6BBF9_9NOCA|nr:glycosyltransferase [Nocardia albiluteola]MBU3067626.1 glycosyltransferase [Nocardia albiluteola]